MLYTAKIHTSGGREHGVSKSSDGHLDIKLPAPDSNESGANPEQLFAAGWSACFEGALGIAASKARISLLESTAIDAEIDLCPDKGEFFLQARLYVSLPGLEKDGASALIHLAEMTCPYSKALKGNVDVEIQLV